MGSGNKQPSIDSAEHISPGTTGDNIEAKRVAIYETLDGVSWSRGGTQLATRIDDSDDPIIYIGKAPVGADESDAVWQIAKLDTSSGLEKTWVDGDALFNNVWEDRTSLTYT